jgi:hypothetical protein
MSYCGGDVLLMKKFYLISAFIVLAGLGLRLFIALRLPSDEPDDGRVYALIARNVLDRHTYSIDAEDPVSPTYIRVPGYPIFLAGVYKVFGDDNNRAVRIIQAVVSCATCLIIALLAYAWTPARWDAQKRRRAFLIALALAAACPFTAIYVGLILTETWAIFFISAAVLLATYALRANNRRRDLAWWTASGLLGGLATLLRPDSAIFVGAVGVLMVLTGIAEAIALARKYRVGEQARHFWGFPAAKVLSGGLALSVGFALALTPWTVRNERVFHAFQPIAPEGAGMPGEFSYSGYMSWLKTWIDDVKWVNIAEWSLDYSPIHLAQLPDSAFDSPEERARVGALLDLYNHEPAGATAEAAASPKDSPKASDAADDDDDKDNGDDSSDDDDSGGGAPQSTNPTHRGTEADVQMTPEIDDAFAQIARERTARHPLRSYFTMPLRRMLSMWFDTHSQYYPFQGELLPLAKLDKDLHQQIWLPLFMLLTLLYTGLALAGAVVLWSGGDSRRWLLLLVLLTLPRMMFLSTLENPEPRYVVELFPLVIAVGALSLANINFSRLREMLRRFRVKKHRVEG